MKGKLKKINIIIVNITLLVIYLALIISCNPTAGKTGYTGSIERAKKLKVFVSEYTSNKKEIKVDSLFSFAPKKIWLEKNWTQTQNKDIASINNGYQLLIEVHIDQNDLVFKYFGHNGRYDLRAERDHWFGILIYGEKIILAASFNNLPKNNKIVINSIKERDEYRLKLENPIILDEILLEKK